MSRLLYLLIGLVAVLTASNGWSAKGFDLSNFQVFSDDLKSEKLEALLSRQTDDSDGDIFDFLMAGFSNDDDDDEIAAFVQELRTLRSEHSSAFETTEHHSSSHPHL